MYSQQDETTYFTTSHPPVRGLQHILEYRWDFAYEGQKGG